MTHGKYSSFRKAGHVADREFLFAMEAMLMRIIKHHDAQGVVVTTELKHSNGPHGDLTSKGATVADVIQDVTGFARSFQITAFGFLPGKGDDRQFMISLSIDPESQDHIYASGPDAIASEAHESMSAAFAEREAGQRDFLQARSDDAASREPELWRRVSTQDALRRRLDNVPQIAAVVCYGVMMYVLITAPVKVAIPIFLLLMTLIGLGFWYSSTIGPRRRMRMEHLQAQAFEAGMIVPGKEPRPIRAICLDHAPVTDHSGIGFDPTIPSNA
jgi:hypothetical protein